MNALLKKESIKALKRIEEKLPLLTVGSSEHQLQLQNRDYLQRELLKSCTLSEIVNIYVSSEKEIQTEKP